jgi:YVTN family beta-propeller protein
MMRDSGKIPAGFFYHQGTDTRSVTKNLFRFLCVSWCLRVMVGGLLILSAFTVVSCKKDDPPKPPESPGKYENGLLVLNEGLFQQNNSSLSFYSLENKQVYTQAFLTENGRGLGDTGNDFKKYTLNGVSYILVAVDISSQLEIVEAATLKSVAQIPLFDGTSAREPRHIEIYGNTAYVCNFDGTVSVIDLQTNAIAATLVVGANPDGLMQVGNKLYVANSGGLNYPVYDSTMSVIDMNTKEVIQTFETRINSSAMVLDSQNEIYLLSAGNYADVDQALVRISTTTNSVLQEFDVAVGSITQVGDWLYYYDMEANAVRRFNMIAETFEGTNLIDASGYETFYGMKFIAELGWLFCFDAEGYVNSSTIRAYTPSGVFQFEFTAEINAKKIIYNE